MCFLRNVSIIFSLFCIVMRRKLDYKFIAENRLEKVCMLNEYCAASGSGVPNTKSVMICWSLYCTFLELGGTNSSHS